MIPGKHDVDARSLSQQEGKKELGVV